MLVLVIDAMSMPVFRELENDLVRHGWVELVAVDMSQRPVVIAALPTVTEFSRTSLLCGEITSGNALTERTDFPGTPACARPAHRQRRRCCSTREICAKPAPRVSLPGWPSRSPTPATGSWAS